MIVRTNENLGECVIVFKSITSLLTIVNGAIYAKGYGVQDRFIKDMPGVIIFLVGFIDGVKRKPAAQ